MYAKFYSTRLCRISFPSLSLSKVAHGNITLRNKEPAYTNGNTDEFCHWLCMASILVAMATVTASALDNSYWLGTKAYMRNVTSPMHKIS